MSSIVLQPQLSFYHNNSITTLSHSHLQSTLSPLFMGRFGFSLSRRSCRERQLIHSHKFTLLFLFPFITLLIVSFSGPSYDSVTAALKKLPDLISFSREVSILMNKMKRVAVNSHQFEEESNARIKKQRLLQEFLELQKEFVPKKKKMEMAKQKREVLLAEVRFLRLRHKYLKIQSQKGDPDLVGPQNSYAESKLVAVNRRNSGANEVVLKHSLPVQDLNPFLGDEECSWGKKQEVALRVEKKPKTYLSSRKGVGKKKISWQDQVALKV